MTTPAQQAHAICGLFAPLVLLSLGGCKPAPQVEKRPQSVVAKASPKKEAVVKPDVAAAAPSASACKETASPFDVHGDGTKAGVVRHFRAGTVFSTAGGEGGTTSLKLVGLRDGKLRLTRLRKPWGETDAATAGAKQAPITIAAGEDGAFTTEQTGTTVETEGKSVVQRGAYRITAAGAGCFRVELTADIPPYAGE
ncbi:MAG: hypothetical protein KC502_01740 [Myxococcales bacterium]|nr:hypothetical protein [Myxococcales bacterium]